MALAGDAKDRRAGSESALSLEFRVYAVERQGHYRPPKDGTPSIFARGPARVKMCRAMKLFRMERRRPGESGYQRDRNRTVCRADSQPHR